MEKRVKIGTLEVPKGERHRISYETASWYTDIESDGGPVDVFACFGADGRVSIWPGVHYMIPGKVVASAFPSSFGGVQYGGGNRNRDLGQQREKSVGMYGYLAARQIAEGKLAVSLLPGFSVERDALGWTIKCEALAQAVRS